jgi:hypothetical protein
MLSRFALGPLLRLGLLAQPFALRGLPLCFGFLLKTPLVVLAPLRLGLRLTSLFRREPGRAQFLDDLAAKGLDLFPEVEGVDRFPAVAAPVDILPLGTIDSTGSSRRSASSSKPGTSM